jgi:transcriptional regulator with XRE-family HTH domain
VSQQETAEFAALLRQLKERSGLSYGTLGKRLHLSPSSLHRYSNGEAVPADYAPIERFARLCKATPDELLDLHRRWLLADAARAQARKEANQPRAAAGPAAAEHPGPAQSGLAPPGPAQPAAGLPAAGHLAAGHPGPGLSEPDPSEPRLADPALSGSGASDLGVSEAAGFESTETVPADSGIPQRRSRGQLLIAVGAAALAAIVAVSAYVLLSPDDDQRRPGAGVGTTGPPPLTAVIRPYAWRDDPCVRAYLLDRNPAEVPPPPAEADAEGWVKALGAVPAKGQLVEVTFQGTGASTVVLQALHVRVVNRKPRLPWKTYHMADGCGGGASSASFEVDLDRSQPSTRPTPGQHNFPFKVSQSDPEVLYVTGFTSSHDVTWYLELEWSSANSRGTLRIDDHGRPFRTSATSSRGYYGYPIGWNAWVGF